MNYKLVGITDEKTWCDFCGRMDLKRVMMLEDENGEFKSAGMICGAKMLGISKSVKSFEQIERIQENKKLMIETEERAKELSIKFNDDIAITKTKHGYNTVRGKAFNLNPFKYGSIMKWITI